MPELTELIVGTEPWRFMVPAERAVTLQRVAIVPPNASPADLVRESLEKPFGFEPMRRALTPDDHITIVIDPQLPHLTEMLAEILRHLESASVKLSAVTVLSPPGSPSDWIDELPDEFADVTAETHDPLNPKKLAYLATTKAGRRIYLNRSLVEADFVIVLTGRRFDPHCGHAGAENAIFPSLSDEETRAAFAGDFTTGLTGTGNEEPAEVAWLLGTPFLVQVIEGEGESIQEVVAGLLDSAAEGKHRQDARWCGTVAAPADCVIAAIGDTANRVSFADLAKAAATAARIVKKGGRIALLTAAAPDLGQGAQLLRTLDGPSRARNTLAKEKPEDWAAAALWAFATASASVFLASGYPDDVAEELFATPIHTPGEVQRLIDTSEAVLLIPDAHKMAIRQESA